MKFVHPGTPYPKDRLGIQVVDSSLSTHPTNGIDDFRNRLVEICQRETQLYRRQCCYSMSQNAIQSLKLLHLIVI